MSELAGAALSRLDRARGTARCMVTWELKAALASEPEGTTLWLALCEEATARVKWGSLNARHVPASYSLEEAS